MERQETNTQTFQAAGVNPELAAQAGAISDRQATDSSYTLSNDDRNILQAAFNQMLQQQIEEAERAREEKDVDAKVHEYVLLMDQAQETESIGLVDAAAQIRMQLVSEGRLSAAEFEKRVAQQDNALMSEGYDEDDSDDAAFEARFAQELGAAVGNLQQGSDQTELQLQDRDRELREQHLDEDESEDELKARARHRSRSHTRSDDFEL